VEFVDDVGGVGGPVVAAGAFVMTITA